MINAGTGKSFGTPPYKQVVSSPASLGCSLLHGLHLKQTMRPASINHDWPMLLMNLFDKRRYLVPVVSYTQRRA